MPFCAQIVSVQPKTDLKKSLMVKFAGEEGIDQGGVKKEFFQILTRRMFDPGFGTSISSYCWDLLPDSRYDLLWCL